MVSNLRREDKAAEAAQYDFFPVTSGPATPHRGVPSRRFAPVAASLLHRSRDETNAPPRRYLLPMEYGVFVEDFKRQLDRPIWIAKPTGKAQARRPARRPLGFVVWISDRCRESYFLFSIRR
jgi:hypothetical protein